MVWASPELEAPEAESWEPGAPGPGTSRVAFESKNRLTNTGDSNWVKETGLLSVWILGQFNPSPETTVIVPYRGAADDPSLGPVVNDAYFGKVPSDRLVVTATHVD